ncbi:MAG: Bcr/CflA family efflux MFS transporter [Alphaproteobacteria bacterium]|nr:Bcr/CflA family efflux MFS transporter [Alphaproteobacteria bacterium]
MNWTGPPPISAGRSNGRCGGSPCRRPSVVADPRNGMLYLLGILSAAGWVGGVMYIPTLPAIAAEFDATPAQTNLTLTVFLAAFATAQLVYGPLSDRYGRRIVLLATLLVYCVGSVMGALADSIGVLTVARVVQAIGAVGGIVLTRAIARDLWTFDQVRRPLAFINMGSAVAPVISLSLGGFLSLVLGWRGIFWIAAVIALAVFVLVFKVLRETHAVRDPAKYGGFNFIRNLGRLVMSPLFVSLALTQGMLGGAIFVFMTGAPFVVIERFGISPGVFGLLTALMPAGYISGNLITSRLSNCYSIPQLITLGSAISVTAASTLVVVGLAGTLSVPVLYGCMYCYVLGVGVNVPNSMAVAIEVRPETAGAASALIGFVQQSHSAGASLIVGMIETGSGLGMVSLLFAMAAIGCTAAATSIALSRSFLSARRGGG